MKKLISMLLALVLVLSLAACAAKPATETPPTADSSTAETPAATDEASAAETTDLVTTISEPVTIQFWHCISQEVHLAMLEKEIAEFNAGIGAEQGITVEATYQGSGGDLYTNTLAALKTGTVPDVVLSYPIYTADYLQTDYVVNLDAYVNDATVGITDKDDIITNFWDEGYNYAKEGCYSLPYCKSAEVLYYNVDFFEENNLSVPTTWDELVDLSQQIYDLTGAPAFGWDNLWSAMMTLTLQMGGSYADAEGNLQFLSDDTTAKAISFVKEQIDKGIWRTAGEDMYFSGPFANEAVPMYIGVTVEAAYINQKSETIHWAAAPIPQLDPSNPFVRTDGYVVTCLNSDGNAEREYAAYVFAKYLASAEVNLETAQGSGYLPTHQSILSNAEYLAYLDQGTDEAQRAAIEEIDGFFTPAGFVCDTYTSKGVSDSSKVMMQNVLDNGMDIETALGDLASELGVSR